MPSLGQFLILTERVCPEVKEVLKRVDSILDAGDIGKPQVLEDLKAIALVIAVRGNNDKGQWAETIPERRIFETGAVSIYILHDVKELDLDPAVAGNKSGRRRSFSATVDAILAEAFFSSTQAVLDLGGLNCLFPLQCLKVISGRVKVQLVDLAV